ncbi:unnamed protein product [Hermetia illucens]|uniref:MATH domain-containing protein n=1 Tax=Hermetia illucens TaxID=343691 RepID=A0A7R8YWD7_HERIL|nr:unnamed protein product [Hermetia illucens]
MAKITTHGKTAIQPLVHTLNYTVENFTHQCRFPHDEHFFVQGGFELNGIKGFIRLYPRGYSNDDENWLTLYIGLESQSDVEIYMNFEVNIITLVENHEVGVLFSQFQLFFTLGFMWNAVKVVPTKTILKRMLLPDGGLKVRFVLNTHIHEIDRRLSSEFESIWNKIKEMLQQDPGEQRFDIAFVIDNRFFFAHKRILFYNFAFRAILSEWSDHDEPVIQLPCVRTKVFEEMLIDCYVKSNRFCKKCFCVRKSKGAICCEVSLPNINMLGFSEFLNRVIEELKHPKLERFVAANTALGPPDH